MHKVLGNIVKSLNLQVLTSIPEDSWFTNFRKLIRITGVFVILHTFVKLFYKTLGFYDVTNDNVNFFTTEPFFKPKIMNHVTPAFQLNALFEEKYVNLWGTIYISALMWKE